MSRLLALDLSTNVGHGRFRGRGQVPTFGTLRLEGPDLTFKLGAMRGWLYQEYEREPFDGLAWERPILTPKDTVNLLELLYGLAGECYGFIGDLRAANGVHLKWCEVSVVDAKKALTGKARASKDEMFYAARRVQDWRCLTHHEADAGAVGLVAYDRLWPKRAA